MILDGKEFNETNRNLATIYLGNQPCILTNKCLLFINDLVVSGNDPSPKSFKITNLANAKFIVIY